MKLVAAMNVHNELDRYLEPVIEHLLSYCDEVRVQDDGSTDGSYEWLEARDRVEVQRNDGPAWSENESDLHQSLFEWTLEAQPTHILAIDADEMIPRGAGLRAALEGRLERTFMLRMCEIWRRDGDSWLMRIDGGWRPHDVAILYQLPPDPDMGASWQIASKAMASSRVPQIVRTDQSMGRGVSLGFDVLHLGWSDPAEREARYKRYMEVDGGSFHAKGHLDSIMLPDEKIGLAEYRGELVVV